MSTIAELCAKYLLECAKGDSQQNVLTRLQGEPIGKVKAPGTSREYIQHCRLRRASVAPSTVLQDVVYLRGVLSYAKPGWGMDNVTDEPLRDAMPILRKEGLIGTSRRRQRNPTPEEISAIVTYFAGHWMADMVLFLYLSTRRVSEACRLQRGDLNESKLTILVRDMKHPTRKIGNHKQVALPDGAFDVLMRQQRHSASKEERFFPRRPGTVEAAFRKATAALKIEDLHLHDLRRGGTTLLLREGRTPQEIMLVTGHETPLLAMTTYNGMKAEDFHRRAA